MSDMPPDDEAIAEITAAAVDAIDTAAPPAEQRAAAAQAAAVEARRMQVRMTPEAADMIADSLVTKLEARRMFAEPPEPGAAEPAGEPPPVPAAEEPVGEPVPGRPSFADKMLGYR